jgi:hypothetical protein
LSASFPGVNHDKYDATKELIYAMKHIGNIFSTRLLFIAVLSVFAWIAVSTVASQPQTVTEPMAFLGVRILLAENAGAPSWSVDLPTDCLNCKVHNDQITAGQNAKEIFFHISAPATHELIQGIHVRIDPKKVRGVIIGRADADFQKTRNLGYKARVSFKTTADGITFDIPLTSSETPIHRLVPIDVTAEYTFIDTPGVEIRVDHADEQRRRGPYASGRWPAIQTQAALNLEFAAREAINELGLNQALDRKRIAYIHLMGFDTNYPTLGPSEAHDDFPPHWHMIVIADTEPRAGKVGHFLINPDGLLDENLVGYVDGSIPEHYYARGESDITTAPNGEFLYSQMVTAEGYFTLASQKGSCRFVPVGTGYQSGVGLDCGKDLPRHSIRAEDDLNQDQLRLFVDGRLATIYRFDADTGRLLNTTKSPAGHE